MHPYQHLTSSIRGFSHSWNMRRQDFDTQARGRRAKQAMEMVLPKTCSSAAEVVGIEPTRLEKAFLEVHRAPVETGGPRMETRHCSYLLDRLMLSCYLPSSRSRCQQPFGRDVTALGFIDTPSSDNTGLY